MSTITISNLTESLLNFFQFGSKMLNIFQ